MATKTNAILRELADGPLTTDDIAARIGDDDVNRTGSLLHHMARVKGYVLRTEGDDRKSAWALTDAGRAAAEGAATADDAPPPQSLRDAPCGERVEARRGLGQDGAAHA